MLPGYRSTRLLDTVLAIAICLASHINSLPCWLIYMAFCRRPVHKFLKGVLRQELFLSFMSARFLPRLPCVLFCKETFSVAPVCNIWGIGLFTASCCSQGSPTLRFYTVWLKNGFNTACIVFWYHCPYKGMGKHQEIYHVHQHNTLIVFISACLSHLLSSLEVFQWLQLQK